MSLNKLTNWDNKQKKWMNINASSFITENLVANTLESTSINVLDYKTQRVGAGYTGKVLTNLGNGETEWGAAVGSYESYWATKYISTVQIINATPSSTTLVYDITKNRSNNLTNTSTTGVTVTSDGYYDVAVEMDIYSGVDAPVTLGTPFWPDYTTVSLKTGVITQLNFSLTDYYSAGTIINTILKTSDPAVTFTIFRIKMNVTSKDQLLVV